MSLASRFIKKQFDLFEYLLQLAMQDKNFANRLEMTESIGEAMEQEPGLEDDRQSREESGTSFENEEERDLGDSEDTSKTAGGTAPTNQHVTCPSLTFTKVNGNNQLKAAPTQAEAAPTSTKTSNSLEIIDFTDSDSE
jgi:hypothetical protein